jgi:hypothetical protein
VAAEVVLEALPAAPGRVAVAGVGGRLDVRPAAVAIAMTPGEVIDQALGSAPIRHRIVSSFWSGS